MSENFRNKQWFKNMSQERKDEICKKFHIDEKTLRKAGRETDDGRFVIDLLRIDSLNYTPKNWEKDNDSIKNDISSFKNSINEADDYENLILIFEQLYNLYEKRSYLKFKNTLSNRVLLEQARKCVLNDIEDYLASEESDKSYYANRTMLHLKVLLESDLKIVKNKKQ